jgi:hypothetical protein
MSQNSVEHVKVAAAAVTNVPLAGASHFFTVSEPILQWFLTVVQLVVASASAYYIFRKARKPKK